jgi:hypothetical protein
MNNDERQPMSRVRQRWRRNSLNHHNQSPEQGASGGRGGRCVTLLLQLPFQKTGAQMRFSVTSGTGTAEVVDHLQSAKSALDRALTLVARKRKNVRFFDEDGMRSGLRF